MLSRRQPSAPPSSKKTHSQRDTIRPAAPRPTKITFEPLTRPASPAESDEATQSLALNPHKLIPPPPHTPPRFPPSRLFGRLPPCIPSLLRMAGVRKPLTITSFVDPQLEPI